MAVRNRCIRPNPIPANAGVRCGPRTRILSARLSDSGPNLAQLEPGSRPSAAADTKPRILDASSRATQGFQRGRSRLLRPAAPVRDELASYLPGLRAAVGDCYRRTAKYKQQDQHAM